MQFRFSKNEHGQLFSIFEAPSELQTDEFPIKHPGKSSYEKWNLTTGCERVN